MPMGVNVVSASTEETKRRSDSYVGKKHEGPPPKPPPAVPRTSST